MAKIPRVIGTYTGEASVTLSGTAYNRSDNGLVFGDFDVAFYYTAGASFIPGENGPDPAASGTLIGSVQEFEEAVNLPKLVTGLKPTHAEFSHTVDFAGSGIAVGDAVWVRISDGDNIFGTNTAPMFDEPYIDDLSVKTESKPINKNSGKKTPANVSPASSEL